MRSRTGASPRCLRCCRCTAVCMWHTTHDAGCGTHLDGCADGVNGGAIELFRQLLHSGVSPLPDALHDGLYLHGDWAGRYLIIGPNVHRYGVAEALLFASSIKSRRGATPMPWSNSCVRLTVLRMEAKSILGRAVASSRSCSDISDALYVFKDDGAMTAAEMGAAIEHLR